MGSGEWHSGEGADTKAECAWKKGARPACCCECEWSGSGSGSGSGELDWYGDAGAEAGAEVLRLEWWKRQAAALMQRPFSQSLHSVTRDDGGGVALYSAMLGAVCAEWGRPCSSGTGDAAAGYAM